jgi:hypothetical protein
LATFFHNARSCARQDVRAARWTTTPINLRITCQLIAPAALDACNCEQTCRGLAFRSTGLVEGVDTLQPKRSKQVADHQQGHSTQRKTRFISAIRAPLKEVINIVQAAFRRRVILMYLQKWRRTGRKWRAETAQYDGS